MLDAWLLDIRARVKPSTYAAYVQRAEKHLRPTLGPLPFGSLSAADIAGLHRELNALSQATQHGVLCVLNQVFLFARAKGYTLDLELATPRRSVEKHNAKVLSVAELKRLEASLLQDLDEKKLGLLICMYTGLRLGEICALRWEDISLSDQTLYVRRTVQRIKNEDPLHPGKTRILFDTPKSGSSARCIPIPLALTALLKRFQCVGSCFILTSCADLFVDPRTYQDFFKYRLRRAGIPAVNFHALRHTFATRCVELGLDAKSLSEVLGHASVKTTLDVYVHPSAQQVRGCLERMTAQLPGGGLPIDD